MHALSYVKTNNLNLDLIPWTWGSCRDRSRCWVWSYGSAPPSLPRSRGCHPHPPHQRELGWRSGIQWGKGAQRLAWALCWWWKWCWTVRKQKKSTQIYIIIGIHINLITSDTIALNDSHIIMFENQSGPAFKKNYLCGEVFWMASSKSQSSGLAVILLRKE